MIRLEHLTKVFPTSGDDVLAVDDVSLELPAGETCVLLGPSGCGKTTTMKMINRLIQPTSGKIFIDGRDTGKVDPILLRRSIGYVIQQVGLFPNKTVGDNICVVPDLLGWDKKKARTRAAELLELVGMQPAVFVDRYPRELSGGQQQRVGVLRALAADPPVMLMDEPFGAIDPINREAIQDEFLRMQQKLRKTVIFVSHDLDEAVKMADKIAIFKGGRLEQFSSPSQLLARPANSFIEDFLGSDRTLKRLRLIDIPTAMSTSFDSIRMNDLPLHSNRSAETSELAALPVVNEEGRVVGLVSRVSPDGTINGQLRPVPVTIPLNGNLRNAVALMFAHDMHVMPCVDADGILKGVLTWRSIIKSLASFETSQ